MRSGGLRPTFGDAYGSVARNTVHHRSGIGHRVGARRCACRYRIRLHGVRCLPPARRWTGGWVNRTHSIAQTVHPNVRQVVMPPRTQASPCAPRSVCTSYTSRACPVDEPKVPFRPVVRQGYPSHPHEGRFRYGRDTEPRRRCACGTVSGT